MITEIDAGHVIYDDLELMGLERRLKGHLTNGGLEGEMPMVGEKIPDEGMIVIIPKRMSADKTYFNDCSIRGAKDNPVNRFYQKKKQQSNPLNSKAAKTACTAKLLKIIYGICKNKTTYER